MVQDSPYTHREVRDVGRQVSLHVSNVIAEREWDMDVLRSATSIYELSAHFWPHWGVEQKFQELKNSYRYCANPQLDEGESPNERLR